MARIYVGTYAKYNNGSIAGEWLDIEDYADKEDFLAACKELHKDEADPEFMFQDLEDIPTGMAGESFVTDELFEYGLLNEHDQEIWATYRDHVNQDGDFDEAQDAFQAKGTSKADVAQGHYEDTGMMNGVSGWAANYIDWEAVARDMGFEGYTFVEVGYNDVWLFRNDC